MAASAHRTADLLTPRRFFWLLVVGSGLAGFAFGWFTADERATLGLVIAAVLAGVLAILAFVSDAVLFDERHERIAERAGGYSVVVVEVLGVLGMIAVGIGEQFGYLEITPQMVGFAIAIALIGGVNVALNVAFRYRA